MTQGGALYPDLTGKSVIVTGGGSGIGAAIVRGFARQQAKVGFIDIAEAPSRALVAELSGKASVRHVTAGDRQVRKGGWHKGLPMGFALEGKRLGVIGLGKLGSRVAGYAKAFGMEVVAWSQNLTSEKAAEHGARLVSKDELLASSDVITIHLILSGRTRGLIGAAEIAKMKQGVVLVNTSRGPIVEEAALIAGLKSGHIAAAGLDVYDVEPMRPGHPLTSLDNVVLAPHLGYVVEPAFRAFYADAIENLLAWLDGKPIRVMNPETVK